MVEAELAAAVAQFGVAGLIGWMWLSERRSAAARERQLQEAHDRLGQDRQTLDTLLGVVRDNTRAMTGVEGGLERLGRVLERVLDERDAGGRDPAREGGGATRRRRVVAGEDRAA